VAALALQQDEAVAVAEELGRRVAALEREALDLAAEAASCCQALEREREARNSAEKALAASQELSQALAQKATDRQETTNQRTSRPQGCRNDAPSPHGSASLQTNLSSSTQDHGGDRFQLLNGIFALIEEYVEEDEHRRRVFLRPQSSAEQAAATDLDVTDFDVSRLGLGSERSRTSSPPNVKQNTQHLDGVPMRDFLRASHGVDNSLVTEQGPSSSSFSHDSCSGGPIGVLSPVVVSPTSNTSNNNTISTAADDDAAPPSPEPRATASLSSVAVLPIECNGIATPKAVPHSLFAMSDEEEARALRAATPSPAGSHVQDEPSLVELHEAADAMFVEMDLEGKGYVSTEVFRCALPDLSEEEFASTLAHVDADNSGTISREEFRVWMVEQAAAEDSEDNDEDD
jgi:hypothetical protein